MYCNCIYKVCDSILLNKKKLMITVKKFIFSSNVFIQKLYYLQSDTAVRLLLLVYYNYFVLPSLAPSRYIYGWFLYCKKY